MPAEETLQTNLSVWEVREIAAVLLVVLLLTLLAWRQWWNHRARLFLVRLATTDDPRIERLAVRGLIDELFEKHFLLRTVQGFRQRFEVPSSDLDVEETIHATVRNGGWLKPVFGKRSIMPEYLVLIDRASHRDQQARLIDELVGKLEKSHVFVSRYYFDGDPRLCFPPSERELALTLAELRARYPEHRLLLFTDASGLFDFGLGELAPWVEQLAQWKQRALLSPRPMEQWRQRELTLRSQLRVLPATAEGLAHLGRIFNTEKPPALQSAAAPSLMPADLHLRPLRWLSRDAPEDRLVEQVLGDLEQFLGDAGYYWLSACGVYPTLSWDLVLYLGSELRTEEGEWLLTADRLAALGQLPWFRNGYMPDWLRLRLVGGMPRERERAVRGLLTNLLLTTLAGVRHDFYLEIAQRERRTLSRLMRQALDVLARRTPEESPLRDHVFRDFMAGRRKRRLAVRLPERIATLFANSEVVHSPLHKRSRRVTKALLLLGVCLSLAFIILPDSPRISPYLVLLSLVLMFLLGLLGLALKNMRLTLAGLVELLPMVSATYLRSDITNFSIYPIRVSVLVVFLFCIAYVLQEPRKEIAPLAWRLKVLLLNATLGWCIGLYVSISLITAYTDQVSFPISAIAWPCFGLSLAILGYIEKDILASVTGIINMSLIPLVVLAELNIVSDDEKFAGWFFAATLVASLATSLISLTHRKSRGPAEVAFGSRKAA